MERNFNVRGQERERKQKATSNKQCVVNLSKNEANYNLMDIRKEKEKAKIVGVKRKPEIFSMGKIIMSLLITPFISRNSPPDLFPLYRIFAAQDNKRQTGDWDLEKKTIEGCVIIIIMHGSGGVQRMRVLGFD